MNFRAAIGLAALLLAICVPPAQAGCGMTELPAKTVQAEAGVVSDALTGNRAGWNESYLLVAARDGNTRSVYARAATDQRFGVSDSQYEGGVSLAAFRHLNFNVSAAYSPQHQTLPQSALSGGVDVRGGGGYGYQLQYSARSYSTVNADTISAGADRYFRDRRVAVAFSFAQLSNVPGTAVSAGVRYGRYLPCDNESITIATGRDVENTGVGSNLAVYRAYTYDVNDLHWLSPRFAVNLGAGWNLLSGAYDRFEVRFALHERL